MQMLRRCSLVFFVLLPLQPSAAFAAARTFVASYGSDANACSLAQPCRAFAAALAHTSPGGEIVVLDSAGYGPVTIAQSVSIIAPNGVYAGVAVASGDGIIIDASGIDVTLRGLAINGQGGDNGVNFINGTTLTIEQCVVSGMNDTGIVSTASGSLRVQDTILRDNGGRGLYAGAGDATLERVQSERNGSRGLDFGNATAAVHGGMIAHNGFEGISVHNVPTSTTLLAIDGVTISHNADDGISVFSAALGGLVSVTVSNSTISANGGYGISVIGTVNGGPARLFALANTIANNARDGITAGNNSGSSAYVSATRNLVAENLTGGITVTNSSTMIADDNTVVRNVGHGLDATGGTFFSRNNNTVRGNTSGDSFGTITPLGGL